MLSDDYSPYCGLTYNEHNRVERAASAPHIVVSAPTRTGKTRRILAPAAILHPGPVRRGVIQTGPGRAGHHQTLHGRDRRH